MIFSRVYGIVAVVAVAICGQAGAQDTPEVFAVDSRGRGQTCSKHVECATRKCGNGRCQSLTSASRFKNPGRSLGTKCTMDDDCQSNNCSDLGKCQCALCSGSGCGGCDEYYQCEEPFFTGFSNRCSRSPKYYGEYCDKNVDCISKNCYIEWENWTESYCDCALCDEPGCSGPKECGYYGENASCVLDGREWWPNVCQYHSPSSSPTDVPTTSPTKKKRVNGRYCRISSHCLSGACFKTPGQIIRKEAGRCHCNPNRQINTCDEGFYCRANENKKNQCLRDTNNQHAAAPAAQRNTASKKGTGSACRNNNQCKSGSCFRTARELRQDTPGVCECTAEGFCGTGRTCVLSDTAANTCRLPTSAPTRGNRLVGQRCETNNMCQSNSCFTRPSGVKVCQCNPNRANSGCQNGRVCKANSSSANACTTSQNIDTERTDKNNNKGKDKDNEKSKGNEKSKDKGNDKKDK
mmetsp:Transcript_9118/g.20157  ORF Transcript_9118/g.20157 Transcript_9118/m.20157 type:complete len:464 (-) Transcript_9118:180-1571(-)